MYEDHFGLNARPFAETVRPADFIALPSRESALHRLRYGLEHGQGPALLFGPSGSGKTLLARTLARDLGWPMIHLTYPAMPADELLALLVDELAPSPAPASPSPSASLGSSVRRLRALLSAAALRGERPLLIVDEAHLIDDPATFEALRLLLNFRTSGPPDLSLLLVGGAEVLLNVPPGLTDRLTARTLIGALTEAETALYIDGRLAAAGAKSELFDPETLAELHLAADGLPRRLGRLADLCLLIAYAEGRPRPDPRIVAIAAREVSPDSLAA